MSHLLTLRPAPPYRFDLLLDLLSRYDPPALDLAHDDAYWRVLRSGGGLALVRVQAQGDDTLHVEWVAAQGEVDAEALRVQVTRLLPVHVSRADFYARARQESALWQVVEPLVGLPELRTASAFEALCQAVIEQQITWRAALRAQRWLAEWGGAALEHEGRRYYAFPSAHKLAKAQVQDLTPTKITFRRMQLLIDLAQQVDSGALDLEVLADVPPDEAMRRLTAINGIGQWTAAVALSRAFGHPHYAPNDVALQAAVNHYFYDSRGTIPPEQVTRTFAPYAPHAALVAQYTLLRWVFDQYPRLHHSAM